MALTFGDIIGQQKVVEQLKRSVDENRLAHALLITGPRGNGKLPIAVALAFICYVETERVVMLAAPAPRA